MAINHLTLGNGLSAMKHLSNFHSAKFDLCQELEKQADALPYMDRFICLRIANELVPLLTESHRYEEENIFPHLQSDDEHNSVVARLKYEHLEDMGAAEELTEVLLEIGHGKQVANPEAIGFMLRSFFTSLRRHVEGEKRLLSISEWN